MKLTLLQAQFLRFYRKQYPKDQFVDGVKHTSGWGDTYKHVNTLAKAHGISFLCPKDFAKNKGTKGTHTVIVWFEGSKVPSDVGTNTDGKAVRWKATGTSLEDLTLTPSILEQSGDCQWHGFITNGDAA